MQASAARVREEVLVAITKQKYTSKYIQLKNLLLQIPTVLLKMGDVEALSEKIQSHHVPDKVQNKLDTKRIPPLIMAVV